MSFVLIKFLVFLRQDRREHHVLLDIWSFCRVAVLSRENFLAPIKRSVAAEKQLLQMTTIDQGAQEGQSALITFASLVFSLVSLLISQEMPTAFQAQG